LLVEENLLLLFGCKRGSVCGGIGGNSVKVH
jgi:hypothetical protein